MADLISLLGAASSDRTWLPSVRTVHHLRCGVERQAANRTVPIAHQQNDQAGRGDGEDQLGSEPSIERLQDGSTNRRGRSGVSWLIAAVAFAGGLAVGILVPGVTSEEDPDLVAMCAMLDGFDEGIFDRRDEISVEDPNLTRLAAISYSAQAAGQSDPSLQGLAEAGQTMHRAAMINEWDEIEGAMDIVRNEC